jgi:hypothetical protein
MGARSVKLTGFCSPSPKQKLRTNLAGLHNRMANASRIAMRRAAAMIEAQTRNAIASAGNFADLAAAFHATVTSGTQNMKIAMGFDEDKAAQAEIFAKGGTIHGDPLLWIPLSFSDAVGISAKNYSGQLVGVQPKSGGRPLLISTSDRLPKYFGIDSVTIPKKFDTEAIRDRVMANFREYYDTAFKAAED